MSPEEASGAFRLFRADLHIHTVLSPCGELEMGAPDIVARALEEGLDIIAVTDHNAADNCPAVIGAAKGTPLVVLPGMEVQTAEDIHVVCLFGACDDAFGMQRWLWLRMPHVKNRSDVFGEQIVVDEENNIVREEEILLVQGVGYSVDEVVEMAHEFGGIAFLAHIDRPSFAYPAVLGPIPDDFPADALEFSRRLSPGEAARLRDKYAHRTILRSSDAHRLEDMRYSFASTYRMEAPTFQELRLAISGEAGRGVLWPFGEAE